MQNIGLILLVFAFVCAVLAALNVPSTRIDLGWAAVAFWIDRAGTGGLGRVLH